MKRLRKLLDLDTYIDWMFAPGLLTLALPDGI